MIAVLVTVYFVDCGLVWILYIMRTKRFYYLLAASIFLLGYFVLSGAYNIGKWCAIRDNAETAQVHRAPAK